MLQCHCQHLITGSCCQGMNLRDFTRACAKPLLLPRSTVVCFVSNPSDPVQGAGQGNGAGPAGWRALSSAMMATSRMQGFGFWVLLALTCSLVCYIIGLAFMDNTDLFHSGQKGQTGVDLIPEIQSAVNSWEKGILATA